MPRTQCFEESEDKSGTSKKALIDNVEPMCPGFADFYLDASLGSSSGTRRSPPPAPAVPHIVYFIACTTLLESPDLPLETVSAFCVPGKNRDWDKPCLDSLGVQIIGRRECQLLFKK